jgi:hypothetical protein
MKRKRVEMEDSLNQDHDNEFKIFQGEICKKNTLAIKNYEQCQKAAKLLMAERKLKFKKNEKLVPENGGCFLINEKLNSKRVICRVVNKNAIKEYVLTSGEKEQKLEAIRKIEAKKMKDKRKKSYKIYTSTHAHRTPNTYAHRTPNTHAHRTPNTHDEIMKTKQKIL